MAVIKKETFDKDVINLKEQLQNSEEGTIIRLTTFTIDPKINKVILENKTLLLLKLDYEDNFIKQKLADENKLFFFLQLVEFVDENFTYDSDENLIILKNNKEEKTILKHHYQDLVNSDNEDNFEKSVHVFAIFENDYLQKNRWYLNEIISDQNIEQRFYFLDNISQEQLKELNENLIKYQTIYSSELYDQLNK